jgi:hypothetical protein
LIGSKKSHPWRLSGALIPSLGALSLLALATPARAQTTCSNVPISSVTAKADDGNVPANVLDGDASSRWSCNGIGCWIRADLGAEKQVGAVDITWYNGDTRGSNYEVSTSRDGSTYYIVASGLSPRSAQPQRITFTAAPTRYVKVTVKGNTTNNWASISELRTLLCGGTSEPTPPTDPTPPTTPPTDPTPPAGDKDVFGVTKLYPSKAGGESWSLAADATKDPRFDPQNPITKNADGSWKIKSNQVRMSAFTSTGYAAGKIPTYNRDQMTSKGYMLAANDWKNIEMTGFVKLNAASDMEDNFDWYARGGKHNDSVPCEGSSYKGALHYDGRARWQKESWHVSYEQAPYKPATSSLKGRWVGFKAVMRNLTVSGKTAVKLELYLNENADKVTWKKIYDMTDAGDWGGEHGKCGASNPAMPMTWGGPIATFRWDNASDVDFKWLSVREIQP